jgi:hypothetical protein
MRRIDWNVVTLLRIIGVAIIVVGVVLAALDASAIDNALTNGTLGFRSARLHHAPMRTFLREAIDYVWKGGLVLVAAEIADRLGWGSPGPDEVPSVDEVAAP